MQKPELLVPAGNLEKLRIGLMYGADACYMGLPSFSMRSRINNFTEESIIEGVRLIRAAGKKFYLTINIYPRGNKVDAFKKHLEFVSKKLKPDAVIVADLGILEMVKEYYPEAEIHISVQANVLNYRAVEFWKKQGAKRIILPRELMLSEIREIHEKVPDMELEFFVHGAICVAYSGRCLLSAYLTGRDANQGICAHSCRWKYRLHNDFTMEASKAFQGREIENNLYLEEEERPGEFMPIDEDEHGTYIMNSRDMCLLPYLKDLVDAGVCSFKVEGRNKTEYYLAIVTKAYRKAIDDMMTGRKFDETLIEEVKKTANRGFISGFLFGFPGKADIYYEKNVPIQTCKFIGMVKGPACLCLAGKRLKNKKGCLPRSQQLYEVEIRNRLKKGQEIEVMTPDGQFPFKIEEMFNLEGEPVDIVHGGAGERILKLKKGLPIGSIIRSAV